MQGNISTNDSCFSPHKLAFILANGIIIFIVCDFVHFNHLFQRELYAYVPPPTLRIDRAGY